MSLTNRLREAALIGHTHPEHSALAQLLVEAATQLEQGEAAMDQIDGALAAVNAKLQPLAQLADAFEAKFGDGTKMMDALSALASQLTRSARDVLNERSRQISAEGWTPQHDDAHDAGELSAAASAYALAAADKLYPMSQGDGGYDREPPPNWMWDRTWWKPGEPRRMLVKAGALVLAEIERLDRSINDSAPS